MRIPARVNAARKRLAGHPPLDIRSSAATVFPPCISTGEAELIRVAATARIDSYTKLEAGKGLYIGELVHVASFCHLGIGGGLTVLEDGTSYGSGAKVISGSNVPGEGHGCSAIDPAAVIEHAYVLVERNATLYAGAVVLPRCIIGEGAVIAAGAVVLAGTEVPAGEIWAGVPARRVGAVGASSSRVRARYTCTVEGCDNPRRPDRTSCAEHYESGEA